MTCRIAFRITLETNTSKPNKSKFFNGMTWLGRQDSNLGMAESKSAALPLGYAPRRAGPYLRKRGRSIAGRALTYDSGGVNPSFSGAASHGRNGVSTDRRPGLPCSAEWATVSRFFLPNPAALAI
jgi:hypothetical protein